MAPGACFLPRAQGAGCFQLSSSIWRAKPCWFKQIFHLQLVPCNCDDSAGSSAFEKWLILLHWAQQMPVSQQLAGYYLGDALRSAALPYSNQCFSIFLAPCCFLFVWFWKPFHLDSAIQAVKSFHCVEGAFQALLGLTLLQAWFLGCVHAGCRLGLLAKSLT